MSAPPTTSPAPNPFKAVVRSLMPFVISGIVAVCVHFGYHPSAQVADDIALAGGAGLTIVLHAAESRWPKLGVLLGYVGAPVYAPSTKVSLAAENADLKARVANLEAAAAAQVASSLTPPAPPSA